MFRTIIFLLVAFLFSVNSLAQEAAAKTISITEAQNHRAEGLKLFNGGQYEKALAAFKEAIRLNPDYARAYNDAGETLSRLSRDDEAFSSFKRAIKLMPELAEAHYNLGTLLYKLNQTDDAIASLKNAIRLKQDYAWAYNNLGVLYSDSGRYKEAQECFKQAINNCPDFALARYNLALCFIKQKKRDDALAQYAEIKKLDAKLAGNLYKDIFSNMVVTVANK